ncbi:hypothetical protein VFMJ11_B0157 (plasmid) [Aliivibrio fischeri MJ11]|uniref:Uncharacterized protein n=1 Tax=Aliivibrio fischeri (strain MJ11) TaxID=388396 RepID=B5EWA0_ALIFM|nr:hypothetical protein VFMJ11_B0157 [Aliivibrio fischeri MJ11]
MILNNWSPPCCPSCHANEMEHKLFSPVPSSDEFRTKNGWYCSSCFAGPYTLGGFTESDAARFSLLLLNKNT